VNWKSLTVYFIKSKKDFEMKIYIVLVALLCGTLIICGQQEKPDMTVNEAWNYIKNPDNHCDSFIQRGDGNCGYANDLYSHANIKVQDKVLQDSIIQRLLIKAQDVDCAHNYPKPIVCVAVDIRANEIEMKVVRELNISATTPIFDVGSKFIQGKFDQRLNDQQTNQKANKLLHEASTESQNIQALPR
jgi:hypothetical protein